ncbi:hypothetical protein LBX01_14990 [Altererythrobacter sp. N1]|nr:hypothetical protein LBX01_14990 [Altererythrobacter sp. N1]
MGASGKPGTLQIRRNARVGDLVLAFNGKRLSKNPHSLRWAGVVSEVLPLEQYWADRRFRGKRPDRSPVPDNIYRLDGGLWHQEPNATHDESNVATDLSGRNVLVFGAAWYFGDTQPNLPEVFDLRVSMNGRRNEPLRQIGSDEWCTLRKWLGERDVGLPVAANKSTPFCNVSRIPRSPALAPKRSREKCC